MRKEQKKHIALQIKRLTKELQNLSKIDPQILTSIDKSRSRRLQLSMDSGGGLKSPLQLESIIKSPGAFDSLFGSGTASPKERHHASILSNSKSKRSMFKSRHQLSGSLDPEKKQEIRSSNVNMLNKLLMVICRKKRFGPSPKKNTRPQVSETFDNTPHPSNLERPIMDRSFDSLSPQRSVTDVCSVIPEQSEAAETPMLLSKVASGNTLQTSFREKLQKKALA